MSVHIHDDSVIQALADAIKAKAGVSGAYTVAALRGVVEQIKTTFATQTKTATPTKSTQTVTPSSGYDGLSAVTINPIPSEYVIPSGSIQITTNGSHSVSGKETVDVNVPIPAFATIYRGSSDPAASLGQNGDIYLKV